MKIFICTIFVLFNAICVHSNGIRVKRGWSADQQKKLVDALNADRQAIGKEYGEKFEILKYDLELEKQAKALPSGGDCHFSKKNYAPMRSDSEGYYERLKGFIPIPFSSPFFDQRQTKIGCNPKYICGHTFPWKSAQGELANKKMAFYGICIMGPLNEGPPKRIGPSLQFHGVLKPDINKYGDLIEDAFDMPKVPVESITSSGEFLEINDDPTSLSRRVIGVTVFLGALVFYL